MLIELLESIEAAPRGNARLDAIADALSMGGATAQRYLVDAHNPFKTFGVAKLPKPANGGLFFQNEKQWSDELFDISEQLATRRLTGNAARDKIAAFLDDCNEPQKKWGSRFLLKDLRLNIGAKEIQKFVGKEVLPLFEVPLAHDYNDFKKWDTKEAWYLEPKLDGGRCVAVFDHLGTVELFSRTGKTWGNFETVRLALQKWAAINDIHDYVLDGEVVSLDDGGRINFQQIQKTMMRRDGIETGTLEYVVFDGCAKREWVSPAKTYCRRFTGLVEMESKSRFPENVRIVETALLQGDKAVFEKMSSAFVERGYEGGIARKADAIVANKRSKDLLKIKTFKDSEAIIVGAVEGTGKYAGMLGALQCQFPDFEGIPGARFEIGSGYDDQTRKELWANKPVGEFAAFKFFELTNDGIPRFPIFRSLRSKDDVLTPDPGERE